MLERHEVEAFLAVAEELHFGRAALRLRVSTTRVSQIVRALERRVGAPLFERTSRRVALTPIGRQLYAELTPAWAALANAVERAIAAGRGVTGTLRTVFTGAAAGLLVTRVAEEFRRRHPECAVEIREAQLPEVRPFLRDGVADLALVQLPPPASADLPAGSVAGLPAGLPAGLIAGPTAGLIAGPTAGLTAGLAVGGVLVREARFVAVPLDAVAVPPPLDRPDATFQELLNLVGAGAGSLEVGAHVRRYYARPDVRYEPANGAPPVEWGLVWPSSAATARVLAFNEAARSVVG